MKTLPILVFLLTSLCFTQPALARYNQFAPVFRYTDIGNAQLTLEVGTLYTDGRFVSNSEAIVSDVSTINFSPGIWPYLSGKVIATEALYQGFKSKINTKFRRSSKTYQIDGDPWVVMSIAGIKPPKPKISITTTTPVLTEGVDSSGQFPAAGEFVVSLDTPADKALTLQLKIAGSAKNTKDYKKIKATLKIPSGNLTAALPIQVIDDVRLEGTEFISLTISSGVGYQKGEAKNAVIQILDND
ncbi:MAG: hypothetical protein ABL925_20405 [Methylococcales bacterium]